MLKIAQNQEKPEKETTEILPEIEIEEVETEEIQGIEGIDMIETETEALATEAEILEVVLEDQHISHVSMDATIVNKKLNIFL